MLDDDRRIAREGERVGDAFQDGREVADRDALGQQQLQHALHARHGDLAGDDVLDQLGLIFGQFFHELLHLAIGEEVGGVGLQKFGQMGGQHRRGIDDGIAFDRRFFLLRHVDPGRREPECGLDRVNARQVHLTAGGIHDHELGRPDLARAGVHFLDLDDVGVGLELNVVEDAHRRHHKAHLDCQGSAQRLDLLGQPVAAVLRVDQRQQRIAELDLEIVDLERGRDRLLAGRDFGRRGFSLFLDQGLLLVALFGVIGQRPGAAGERDKRQHRHAGQERHHQHHRGRHAERFRIAGQLRHQRLVGGAGDARLGDEQAGGGRDDQRRDLRDEAVAHGQQGIGPGGFGERHALLRDADDHAADDIDEDNEKPGDRVAAHEFRGAVHGAEEAALVFQRPPSPARFVLVDQAGGEIGVDRHLLAGHGVEVEAGGDFRDAAGAFGDDHEIHDHQDREHDDADHEIAAHHEIAERLDHVAGGGGAFMAVREDEARGGEVEREPQHGRDQQHGGEGGEFERRVDEQSRHHDQHRDDDRDGEEQVEDDRWQRQDEDDEDRHHADGEREIATAQQDTDLAQCRELEGPCGGRRGCCRVGHLVQCGGSGARNAEKQTENRYGK